MPLSENTKVVLTNLSDGYKKSRDEGTLTLNWVSEIKTVYTEVLKYRISALNKEQMINLEEIDECEFLLSTAVNGWTPADMEMLMELYEIVNAMPAGAEQELGLKLIEELSETKFTQIDKRAELLNKCAGYARALDVVPQYERLNSLINNSLLAEISYAEYPKDEAFKEYFWKDGKFDPNRKVKPGKAPKDYEALYKMAIRKNVASTEFQASVREKADYVMAESTDEKLERFVPNEGQLALKITKSNRTAIKEVYGDEIYDEIDEMRKGSEEERTINIIHSMGTKWMKEGCDVLEIDFAGSGFKEVRREHHGQHGKIFADGIGNPKNTIEAEYGPLVPKANGELYSHLRAKNVPVSVNGVKKNKTRYTIAGPTPDLWFKPGMLNWGEYSIENTREYGKKFAVKFLTDIFKKWDNKEEQPHDIHINVTGHSRGAVAAGESIKLMAKWLKDYAEKDAEKNPQKKAYADKVKFDLVLRDPVPGFITKLFHKKNDLRKVPNLNATVFCSMTQEHWDFTFPLQNVRGAKRLIIGTMGHNLDLGQIDHSQVNQLTDANPHRAGFYDAETGEMFRGSGINQMPDGVYIADEKMNIIRITSYSQIGKLIDSVHEGKSKLDGRVETIHDMVRNWFLDNDLKMSFTSEEAREKASLTNDMNMKKILEANNKRLVPIQNAINNLVRCRRQGAVSEAVHEKEQELIKVCREYMKKTSIPAKGDSSYRMNLVSDVLSFTMKDKNYLKRLLDPEANRLENPDGVALDEKIKAHEQRLENKAGYLDRKLEREEKRLSNEKRIQGVINDTAELCRQYVDIMNKTRKGKSQSDTYKSFLKMLKRGAKLGDKTSINEFNKFLKQMVDISEEYVIWHDTPFGGPATKDGQRRFEASKSFKGYGLEVAKELEKLTKFIPEKDISLGKQVQYREKSIRGIRGKMGAAADAGDNIGNIEEEKPIIEAPKMNRK